MKGFMILHQQPHVVAMLFLKWLQTWHATVQPCPSCIFVLSTAGPQLFLNFYKLSATSNVEITTLVCQVSGTSTSKTSPCFLKVKVFGLMEAHSSKAHRERQITGTCCPESWRSLLLRRHSEPAWMRFCATCCRWPALAGGWRGWSPEVPSNTDYAVFLWFLAHYHGLLFGHLDQSLMQILVMLPGKGKPLNSSGCKSSSIPSLW